MNRSRALAALSLVTALTSSGGCWLVWGIEELPRGGESGLGGNGGNGNGGNGGNGNGGNGNGGGIDYLCEKSELTDGPFTLLAVCEGFVGEHLSVSGERIVIAGVPQGGQDADVHTFDLDGNPIAALRLSNVHGPLVAAHRVNAGSEDRIIVAGSYELGTAPQILEQTGPTCAGSTCAFVAAFEDALTSNAWQAVEWLDAGVGGEIKLGGIEVTGVEDHGGDHSLALSGDLEGSLVFFDSPSVLTPSTRAPFLVVADVEGASAVDTRQYGFDYTGSALDVALDGRLPAGFRAFAVGFEQNADVRQATAILLAPDEIVAEAILHEEPPEAGEALETTPSMGGFAYLVKDGTQFGIRRFAYTDNTTTAGDWLELVSAHLRGDNDGALYIGGSFDGEIMIGGTQLTSKGSLDLVLVHIDAADVATPHVLADDSADDSAIVAVEATSSPVRIFLATFTGSLTFGGTTFTAPDAGATLLGSFTPP